MTFHDADSPKCKFIVRNNGLKCWILWNVHCADLVLMFNQCYFGSLIRPRCSGVIYNIQYIITLVCFLTSPQGGGVWFPGESDGGKWSQNDEKWGEEEKQGEWNGHWSFTGALWLCIMNTFNAVLHHFVSLCWNWTLVIVICWKT